MFTVVFNSRASNISYRLVFEPCPCWRKSEGDWLINLNPKNPQYEKGGVRKLIDQEKLKHHFEDKKECIIIIHHEGYGDYEDLRVLEDDLVDEEFNVQICSFPKKDR